LGYSEKFSASFPIFAYIPDSEVITEPFVAVLILLLTE